MKKVIILYSEYSPLVDALKYRLSDFDVVCQTTSDNIQEDDIVFLTNYKGCFDGDAIACHYSLLPAFNSETPVKDAILAGVKVTGLTIYRTKTKQIIAQYPIFVKNEMHYDELLQELTYAEQTIYPITAEKILSGEAVELNSLNGCGSCGGCKVCNH